MSKYFCDPYEHFGGGDINVKANFAKKNLFKECNRN